MLARTQLYRRMIVLAGLALLPASTALAQQWTPRIAVPAPGNPPPQQAAYDGCYNINHDLFGPYRMSFCLNRYGSGQYQVTGGGLSCNGQLNWRDAGGEARIDIHYSWCGRGVGWSADTMVCSPLQPQWPQHNPAQTPGVWNGPNARIAVPVPVPVSQDLRCSYYPGVRGYQPVSVIATGSHGY